MIRLKVTVGAGCIDLDKRATRATMRAAGNEVAAVTRALIRRSVGGGKTYRGPGGSAKAYRGGYKAGRYTASAPGQPPTSVTGTLAGSIVVRPFKSGEGVAVRETAFYALFLSAGARGGVGSGRGGVRGKRNKRGGVAGSRVLAPRPSLTLALEQREASIASRVRTSIADGLKFKRIRA